MHVTLSGLQAEADALFNDKRARHHSGGGVSRLHLNGASPQHTASAARDASSVNLSEKENAGNSNALAQIVPQHQCCLYTERIERIVVELNLCCVGLYEELCYVIFLVCLF